MMLEPVESMSLTIAKAQLKRGEAVTPNIAAVLIWALVRITEAVPQASPVDEVES